MNSFKSRWQHDPVNNANFPTADMIIMSTMQIATPKKAGDYWQDRPVNSGKNQSVKFATVDKAIPPTV